MIESLMTIINSNYEEWHTMNPDKTFLDFEYNLSKMSSNGAYYDLEKLDNIFKTVISKMSSKDLCEETLNWSIKYRKSLHNLILRDKDYYTSF